MSTRAFAFPWTTCIAVVCLALSLPAPAICHAQLLNPTQLQFQVQGPSQTLEMVVNTSRILTLDVDIPKVLVHDPETVRVTPMTARQVLMAALKPGVTQVSFWDSQGQTHTVDVIVLGDARQLTLLLKNEFPTCSLRVRPLASSVVVSGFVDQPETVNRVIQISQDYYPKVITNITVGGVQEVLLHVKMMEVSRTKLRALGFDWANLNGNDFVVQSVSGLIGALDPTGGAVSSGGETVAFGIVSGSNSFFGFLEALRQENMVKVLANPTLVAKSGRPASFKVGGEFPILVPGGLGTVSIEYKSFGTRVDFVPIVLGNGNLHLEIRPQVSEIDETRSVTINNVTVPGLRDRWVDTAVEMRPGQTLALAGLVQERVEAENKGLPWLADLPWAGMAFRRVEEKINEVELLVLVTPELVDALDPHEVPPCLPGTRTTSPNDIELYGRGYTEVPKCCPPGAPPAFSGPGGGWPAGALPPGALPPGAMPMAVPPPMGTESFEEVPPAVAPQPAPASSASAARRGADSNRWTLHGAGAGIPARTVSTPVPPPAGNPRNMDNPAHRHAPPPNSGAPAPTPDPGLIGPLGYDDLN